MMDVSVNVHTQTLLNVCLIFVTFVKVRKLLCVGNAEIFVVVVTEQLRQTKTHWAFGYGFGLVGNVLEFRSLIVLSWVRPWRRPLIVTSFRSISQYFETRSITYIVMV